MCADRGNEIVHRTLDTDVDNPAGEIVGIVADLEGQPMDEMATAWEVVDDLLLHLFSNPPAPEAQAEITFSYEGYRITVEQNGTARFVKTQ